MTARIDLSGRRFGKLTAMHVVSWNPTEWLMKCDCGQEAVVRQGNIHNGHTTSCGCKRTSLHSVTHGHNRNRKPSKTLQSYRHAKSRCINVDDPKYSNYGARGIKMCNEWLADFSAFLRDMGECPHGMTLDRIDNDGNYEPGNCRWATPNEQAQNRSDQWWITHNGQRKKAREWAKELNLSLSTLRVRRRSGWSVAEILAPRKRARTGEGKRSRLRAVTEQRAP